MYDMILYDMIWYNSSISDVNDCELWRVANIWNNKIKKDSCDKHQYIPLICDKSVSTQILAFF